MALVPTLQLWRLEFEKAGVPAPITDQLEQIAIDQLADFQRAGGIVLFGTDVGYTQAYDPSQEYRLLQQAGMDFASVLAALTTAPALRWRADAAKATLAVGQPADLVVLEEDPRVALENFSSAWLTIREGRVIYGEKNP